MEDQKHLLWGGYELYVPNITWPIPTKLSPFEFMQQLATHVTLDQFNKHVTLIEDTLNKFVGEYNKESGNIREDLTHQGRTCGSLAIRLAEIDQMVVELRQKLQTQQPLKIELITPKDTSQLEINAQHSQFPTLLKALANGHNVYLYGPTGTGKTTAGHTAAKALNTPIYPITVNRETSQFQFMGHVSKGEYHPGVAYEPYKNGGILLIDELDNGNANANTQIKVLSDNEEAFFPCGLVQRHKDFRIMACANTTGTGANAQYIGRNQQDKALLNIFKFIPFDIDEAFEESIAWREYISWGGVAENKKQFDGLIKEIRLIRQSINELAINHIISPRNTKFFFRDIARGVDVTEATSSILIRELPPAQAEKVFAKCKSIRQSKPGGLPSAEISKAWGA